MSAEPSSPEPAEPGSDSPVLRPQFTDFSLAKSRSTKGKKHRSRHSHGMAEHSYWQFGVGAIPPLALIGLTLAVLGIVKPDMLDAPIIKLAGLAICGLIVIGLGTIAYGLGPASRRLERKDVWIAIALGIITLGAFAAVQFRDRIFPGAQSVNPTPQQTE